MKEITLTQGKSALVDDSDYQWLSKWKWFAAKRNTELGIIFYAARNSRHNGKNHVILMHRAILGSVGGTVDHRDWNGLNNQRHNLRACTKSQNQMNQRTRIDRYKGVYFNKHAKKWMARITKDSKEMYLGYFDYSTDAAIAYNEAAKRLFGEFASLNIIPE